MDLTEAVLITIVTASTPLLLAAIGELVVERAGVLNLGVEGMMIVGAVAAFAAAYGTGSATLGILSGALAGVALSLLFALFAVLIATNQVATGLALTLFGLGLAGLIGEPFVGKPGLRLDALPIPGLSAIPVIGPAFFTRDVLVYLSFILVAGVSLFLARSRAGLVLRAVGENPEAAQNLGYRVRLIRIAAVAFGGACSGLAGAHLSLAYTPQWAEGMTGGRGWIALALVVFATWMPSRVFLGAYFFGAIAILQLHAQAVGLGLPSQAMTALPYIATIIALVLLSRDAILLRRHTPAALGRPYVPVR